jgi:hypothetical protein
MRKVVSRKTIAGVLAAGIVLGAAYGVAILSGAGPERAVGPVPEVLHAAPAIVQAGRDVRLGAATVCPQPDADPCRIARAEAFVRPAGSRGWSDVAGRAADGGFTFTVPASLVPPDGFAYWLRFTTASGTNLPYPPAGEVAPLRVVTTAGLPVRTVPGAFSWHRRRSPDGVRLRLRYGRGDGEVGRTPERSEEPSEGPSSFDVTPDGSLFVVDWVNRRIEDFAPSGAFVRAFPLPDARPMDVSVRPGGGLYLAELGMDATAFELDKAGRVVGRYPVGYGVSARIGAAPDGPRVLVGPGQWTGVSLRTGVPLPPVLRSQTESSYVPLADGSVAIAAAVGSHRLAVVWTRPDGSRAGALVALPSGVRPGTDYFVHPRPDGGAVAAEALWDDTHAGVALFRFGPTGAIERFSLLAEPTTQQAARFSTVRFGPPSEVLVAYATGHALRIDRFEVR